MKVAASNTYSIFSFLVGLSATATRAAPLAGAWFTYTVADALFGIVPTAAKFLKLMLLQASPQHPRAPLTFDSDHVEIYDGPSTEPFAETMSSSVGQVPAETSLLATGFTLLLNTVYNLACVGIAWEFLSTFHIRGDLPEAAE
eukprot:SAG11_NODE_2177_length_3716_cov_2.968482_3_plen_143_part_00